MLVNGVSRDYDHRTRLSAVQFLCLNRPIGDGIEGPTGVVQSPRLLVMQWKLRKHPKLKRTDQPFVAKERECQSHNPQTSHHMKREAVLGKQLSEDRDRGRMSK
eukprot:scaffold7744_cov90-Cylindrotheca_fusiformis.AAC.3